MAGLSAIAGVLQMLPARARKTLYTIVSLAGVALFVYQALGQSDLGPISIDRALQVYALISPAVGAVAVANVTPHGPTGQDVDDEHGDSSDDFGEDFEDEFDVASFRASAIEDEFTA